jgi:acyl carrier protein
MEEALDAETNTLKLSTQLDDLDWDSLAMISAIAIVDQFSGIVLKADVINQCKTLGDICDLADKRNG